MTQGTTNCLLSALTVGDSYTFVVVATSLVGQGPPSAATSSVTLVGRALPPGVPEAPSNVQAAFGDSSASLSWTPGSSNGSAVTSFTVTATDETDGGSSTNGTTCTYVVATMSGNHCTISGLTNGDAYTFTVSATNAINTSPDSAPSPQGTPAGLPGAPSNVRVTSGDGQVTVRWSPAKANGSSISRYEVTLTDISHAGSSTNGTACTTRGRTTCLMTGLSNGDSYKAVVVATNGLGSGPRSSASAVVTPAGLPESPRIMSLVPENHAVVVVWDEVSDNGAAISKYEVVATDVTNQGSNTSGATCTSVSVLNCTVTGLTDGEDYSFTVSATNQAGTSPSSTSVGPVRPVGPPEAPFNVHARAGESTVTVVWSPPADNGAPITGYTASARDRSNPSGSATGLTCVTQETTCTISGLTNGDDYEVLVTATNKLGVSADSAPSNLVKVAGLPGAPTSVKAKGDGVEATITWLASADHGSPITGYQVSDGIGDACTTTGALSCVVGDLNPGGAYVFRVVASNAIGQSQPGTSNQIEIGIHAQATFSAKVGSVCRTCSVTIDGSGLKAGTTATITLHSKPVTLGSFEVPSSGSIHTVRPLPQAIPSGTHTIILEGTSKAGTPTTLTWFIKIAPDETLVAATPGAPVLQPPWDVSSENGSVSSGSAGVTTIGGSTFAAYNPVAHPSTAQSSTLAAAMVAGTLGAGAGAAAGGGSAVRAGASRRQEGGDMNRIRARSKRLDHQDSVPRTWISLLKSSVVLNGLIATLATRVGRFSAMGFSLVNDGAYLRGTFGVACAPLYLLAAILGILAVVSTSGAPLPPVWWLLGLILVLGVFDALAGLLAGMFYLGGIILCGGWAHLEGIRVSGGVATLFVILILAARYVRAPGHFSPTDSGRWFDRGTDVITGALVAMFIALKLIGSLSPLARAELPISEHEFALVLMVGVAIALRYCAQIFLTYRYTQQIVETEAEPATVSHPLIHGVGVLAGGGVLLLFTSAFVGWTAALWIAVGIGIIRGCLERWGHLLPKNSFSKWFALTGVFKFCLVILMGLALSHLLRFQIKDEVLLLAVSAILLSTPSLLIDVAKHTADSRKKINMTWPIRVGGAGLVLLCTCAVIGVIKI